MNARALRAALDDTSVFVQTAAFVALREPDEFESAGGRVGVGDLARWLGTTSDVAEAALDEVMPRGLVAGGRRADGVFVLWIRPDLVEEVLWKEPC
jgi:hypothetical protein